MRCVAVFVEVVVGRPLMFLPCTDPAVVEKLIQADAFEGRTLVKADFFVSEYEEIADQLRINCGPKGSNFSEACERVALTAFEIGLENGDPPLVIQPSLQCFIAACFAAATPGRSKEQSDRCFPCAANSAAFQK